MASEEALLIQLNQLASNVTIYEQQANETVELIALMWRVTAIIFVMLMQLGFSMLEAGTVRFKNTRNIMIKNVLDTCVSAIAFWLFGYAIGFGEGSRIFGWQYSEGQNAFAVVQDAVQYFYAFAFCATSATIFAGAVAERTHLLAYLFFNFFLAALIYPVVAHLVWSDNGLVSADRGDIILHTHGVLDNAGSLVVHVTGGVTSLIAAWIIGPRIGRFDIDGKMVPFKGHSMVFIASGTIILWVGFYGFNAGSVSYVLQESPDVWITAVGRVVINTTVSASFAGVTVWTLTYRQKEPVPEDTFNGVIGGLVAACATSSLVEPYAAMIIGIVAGGVYLLGVKALLYLQIDDPVGATPVHLGCGSWGALAVGLFATKTGISSTYGIADPISCGLFYGCSGWQLLMQFLGLLLVLAWVGSTSFLLFFLLNFFDLLRVKRQEEEVGLDVMFHGGDEMDEQYNTETDDMRGGGNQRFLTWKRLRALPTPLALLHCGPPGAEDWSESAGRPGPGIKQKTGPFWNRLLMGGDSGESAGSIFGGRSNAGAGRRGVGKREVWHKVLENTGLGQLSLAMYEANYVMEDAVEVEGSGSMVFIGVHDGHSGSEAAEYLRDKLYSNLKREFAKAEGSVTVEALRDGFRETDTQFTNIVRDVFDESPHLATVGACSAVAVITRSAIWVANVGDCRAVLGQTRRVGDSIECRAIQLSVDHNLTFPDIRKKFIEDHASMPDAVTEKRGRFRVKGKVTITRAFGDLYLKHHEFNREPLFTRFRVPEPFNPPLLTSEPHVSVRLISPHDSFIIVASDGLFELISNQEAVDIVASSQRKDIARQLIRVALRRASEKKEVPYQDLLRMAPGQRRDYHDDITVVVFFFDHEALKKPAGRNFLWKKEVSLKGGNMPAVPLASASSSSGKDKDFDVISSLRGFPPGAREAIEAAKNENTGARNGGKASNGAGEGGKADKEL